VPAPSKLKADRGLTTRMLITIFLLGLLYAIFVTAALFAGVTIELVVGIAVVVFVIQFLFTDKIALFAMHGRIVTREQAPKLHGVIDRLCAMADLPKPQVAVAQSDIPNAFATGRNPSHAVVCVTSGLLRRLDEGELEAVLAHELSHVAHRDVAVMTVASFLGVIAGIVTRLLFWTGLFGGFGGGRGGRRGNAAIIEMGMMLFSMVVYFISFLLVRTLSRYRELAADRSGAILIGQPARLASALRKVTGEISRIPTKDLRAAEHFNAFYFAPALTRGTSVATIFATHPSLQVRLDQLAKLEAEMAKQR
jgi:heat shock protein HtpX